MGHGCESSLKFLNNREKITRLISWPHSSYSLSSSYTVVSVNINIMKKTFLFKCLLLTSFFRITSLQVIKVKLFKLTASLSFHIFVYPCCLKLDKNQNSSRLHYIDIIAYHCIYTECLKKQGIGVYRLVCYRIFIIETIFIIYV